MISVKPISDNFESMPDNVKKDLLSFNENKNKVTLEATTCYRKKSGRFSGPLFE